MPIRIRTPCNVCTDPAYHVYIIPTELRTSMPTVHRSVQVQVQVTNLSPVPLSAVRYCPLSAVCCPLSATRCPLSAVCCLLSAVRCPLPVVHCLLSAVHCLLSDSCLLSAVRCLLSVVRCPLSAVRCPLSARWPRLCVCAQPVSAARSFRHLSGAATGGVPC